MDITQFVQVAVDLEDAGLLWQPEIGDEVSQRESVGQVSILVDPQGRTPRELREMYLWLPTVEQIVTQFEIRQAILFHAGLDLEADSLGYKTVVQMDGSKFETSAQNLRTSLALSLRKLLLGDTESLH